MSTDIFYALNDGKVYSHSTASYASARSGSGLASNDTSAHVGQVQDPPGTWDIFEGFLDFDTSSVPDNNTVSSAILSLKTWSVWTTSQTFEARLHDYGASITTADWVAGANLSGKTLLASASSSGWSNGNYYDFSDTAMSANVNKTGSTRMVLCTSDMVNGTGPAAYSYDFNVFRTSIESGTASDPKLTVIHAPVAPGAPTIGTATAGNAQATVTWSAPASNGGATITNYRATSSPGGLYVDAGTSLSGIVTGLTNGTSYTFTVTATNSAGTGPASAASNSVVPVAPATGRSFAIIIG